MTAQKELEEKDSEIEYWKSLYQRKENKVQMLSLVIAGLVLLFIGIAYELNHLRSQASCESTFYQSELDTVNSSIDDATTAVSGISEFNTKAEILDAVKQVGDLEQGGTTVSGCE